MNDRYKKLINVLILGILLVGNIEGANAQFFKKLKGKVSNTVTETVDKVASKKNNPQKPNSQKSNKETHQNKTNNTKPVKQEIDYSDIYTIKSPYSEFKSIHLQAYKGLPRFGNHNPYYFKNKYGGQGIDRVKNTLLTNGYQNYGNLITMHYSDSYYKDIDHTSLTVIDYSNKDNKKDLHSSVAQKQLLITAYRLATENTIKTFFCDVKNNPQCRKNHVTDWGGTRDEFVIQEKYSTFVNQYLDKLLKWSKEFFKDSTQTGYFVNRHKFETSYDFDAQGYWTPIFPSNAIRYKGYQYRFTGDEAFFFEFLPITKYGNKHLNRMTDPTNYYPLVLLKMNAETAEALINKNPEFVYSATKVKITFKALNDSQIAIPSVAFTYHLLNPVIEFFEDIQLTKKIGEINLERVVYKKSN